MSRAAVVLCVVAFHSVRPLLANKMFVHRNVRRTHANDSHCRLRVYCTVTWDRIDWFASLNVFCCFQCHALSIECVQPLHYIVNVLFNKDNLFAYLTVV